MTPTGVEPVTSRFVAQCHNYQRHRVPPSATVAQNILNFDNLWYKRGQGQDSSVSIAIRFGLDGPGIESRFSAPVQTGPGAHPASYTMGTGSFSGVKRPGYGFDHPPTSSAEVKGKVELYLYSTSGPSWPVTG
jgi:hypothetical protein